MSEALIRAEIKTILEAVSGIGVVHDYKRYSRSKAVFLELMRPISGGMVNGWMIHWRDAVSVRDTMPTIQRNHTYEIIGFYELNDAIASGKVFDALLNAIYAAFKSNYTLNGTALNSDPVTIESDDTPPDEQPMLHFGLITLSVQERDTY